MFGTLQVSKGKANGIIESDGGDLGEVIYFGHQDCRWDQLVKLGSFTIYWPCFGTWKDPVRTCSQTISPSFTIGMVFAVKAVDINVQPSKTFFNVEDDGKVGACSISIDKMFAKVPPIYSIAPQIPIGGEVARVVNDLISVATGGIETELTAGLLNLYSLMTFVGYGKANPVINNCPH